jgi:hypothetical protein
VGGHSLKQSLGNSFLPREEGHRETRERLRKELPADREEYFCAPKVSVFYFDNTLRHSARELVVFWLFEPHQSWHIS